MRAYSEQVQHSYVAMMIWGFVIEIFALITMFIHPVDWELGARFMYARVITTVVPKWLLIMFMCVGVMMILHAWWGMSRLGRAAQYVQRPDRRRCVE